MGKITILPETPKNPITLAGKMAGFCYGSNIEDDAKNYKRGLGCIKSGHGRVLEFAEAYFQISDYSARVIREFYTHIGGAPTRLQSSTRYVNYSNFTYVVPPSIEKNEIAADAYQYCMYQIGEHVKDLLAWGIPKEDVANLLPLGMTTDISVKMNARTMDNMFAQRKCGRAYWEFRDLVSELEYALRAYSDEWDTLMDIIAVCKCDRSQTCMEEFSCGKYPRPETFDK